jgi:hypothetical protein
MTIELAADAGTTCIDAQPATRDTRIITLTIVRRTRTWSESDKIVSFSSRPSLALKRGIVRTARGLWLRLTLTSPSKAVNS